MRNAWIKVEGTNRVLARLQSIKKGAEQGIDKGTKEAAEIILARGNHYVPVDTGALQASGKIEKVTGKDRNYFYQVAYETPYAVAVHERLDVSHGAEFNAKHALDISLGVTHARRPQERAKFLEKAAEETRKDVRDAIKKRMVEGIHRRGIGVSSVVSAIRSSFEGGMRLVGQIQRVFSNMFEV